VTLCQNSSMNRSATPILDLRRPVPLPQDGITLGGLLKAVPAALGLIAIFAFLMVLIFTHESYLPAWLVAFGGSVSRVMDTVFNHGALVAVVVLLGVPFLATVIHEVGHATSAIALGWPVREFRVVPFSIKKGKDGWKLNFSWRLQPTALVVAEPLPFAGYHVKESVFAIGGPAANLLSCAFCIVLDPGPSVPFLHAVSQFFLAWSGFLGITNLLPFQHKGLELDGYSVFVVTRSRHALAVRIASLRLSGQILRGKPANCLNRRWLALAESSSKVSQYNRASLWLAYSYCCDQKQFDRAAGLLEKMLRGCQSHDVLFRALLFAECAVFSSMQGNSEAAIVWNARTNDLYLPEYLRRRANSYVAWVQGDKAGAMKEALAAREATGKLEATSRDAFLSSWNRWIDATQASLSSQPADENAATSVR